MTLSMAIQDVLQSGPKTVEEIADGVCQSPAEVRNALSNLYFDTGAVGCDARGRYHNLGSNGRHANGAVIRYLAGQDVRA